MLGKFFRKAEATVPAQAGFQAQPLVVTHGAPASSADKIEHAKYRLNAIRRTIAQSGSDLTREHLAEFKAETRSHVFTLLEADQLTEEHALYLIREGKGAEV